MADNSSQGGTDTIRDLARAAGSVKTQVMQLDLGGASANAEVLITAGQQVAAASVPVVLASDASSLPDLTITGQGSQTVLNQNVLLAVAGTGATDATGYRTIVMHLITGAGTVTAGILKLEQSNDNTNWVPVQFFVVNNSVPDGSLGSSQLGLTASLNSLFVAPLLGRYVRLRISTGLTGTTTGVQCITHLKSASLVFSPYQSQLQVSALPTLATVTTVTTANTQPKASTTTAATLSSAASTNATSVKASQGQLFSIAASNVGAATAFLKLYNKASAPTVGTDVPVLTIPITASGVQVLQFGTQGQVFSTGIAFAITNLVADSDATAIAAAQVKVMLSYV